LPTKSETARNPGKERRTASERKNLNTSNVPLSQTSNKTFWPPRVSDQAIAESAPGQHQRLIRRPDGRHELIVRDGPGIYRHIPLLTFEAGVQA
jgi:hypothetical protein